eukprot:NODE_1677_length_1642_cov_85.609612_g1597_i0.p1 GENE.NODE_1677_length_1642_cov_85.609612_g1597_i0~~NODE_1677_length_1642_cov_85.609612_g1597_i0.p1  ORF type:complete len:512 (-),score=67.07 NODE_1677_length_1642_cov_85.609612_g1597_i0:5-1540(-)
MQAPGGSPYPPGPAVHGPQAGAWGQYQNPWGQQQQQPQVNNQWQAQQMVQPQWGQQQVAQWAQQPTQQPVAQWGQQQQPVAQWGQWGRRVHDMEGPHPAPIWMQQQQPQQQQQVGSGQRGITPTGPLPEGWEARVDDRNGVTYYINHLTKTTTWDDPRKAAGAQAPARTTPPPGITPLGLPANEPAWLQGTTATSNGAAPPPTTAVSGATAPATASAASSMPSWLDAQDHSSQPSIQPTPASSNMLDRGSDVRDFLGELELTMYTGQLIAAGFDSIPSLLLVKKRHLTNIGMKEGHQVTLLHAVKHENKKRHGDPETQKKDVVDFLQEHHLERYSDKLLAEGYDSLPALMKLTDADMVRLDVKPGHQTLFREAVEALQPKRRGKRSSKQRNQSPEPGSVTPHRDHHAFVIGNSAYTNMPPLRTCQADCKAVSEALKGIGYNVYTHVDLSRRALKDVVKSAMDAEGKVVFYFAGYGVQSHGHNYLLPVDAVPDSNDISTNPCLTPLVTRTLR